MSEVQLPVEGSSRTLYAFGFTALFNDTATEMAYWVLPAFLTSIGAGPAQLGLIEGIAESVASFMQLFSGYLADRLPRRKPVVVGGYFVANAVKPLLAFVTSWWQVLGIRFAARFCKGIRSAPRDVMVADLSAGRLGSAYGLLQAMDSAGAVLGPLAALLLIARIGMRNVFLAAAIPGAACFLIALVGIRESNRNRAKAREKAEPAQPLTERRNESFSATLVTRDRLPRAFYFILFVVTLFSLGNSSDMFLVLRAESVGIPASHAPLLGLVFNITYTLFSWPAGRVSDRWSRRGIAAGGYLVYAAVYLMFGLAPSSFAIWIAMASYGLFYALTAPVLKALVVDSVAPGIRGRALGVYSFLTSLAILIASVAAGELWKHFGAAVPFYVSSATAAVSAGLLLFPSVSPNPAR
jgi:MFS family permease